MRYYVISDVHGYYTQMKSALEKAGFFSDTTPHKLVMLGDLFDRGHEAKQHKAKNFTQSAKITDPDVLR